MFGYCGNYLFGPGGRGFFPFAGIIFWLALFAIVGISIFFLVRMILRNNNQINRDAALEILRKRYVNGEISKEEFDAKKKDLL